MMRPMPASAAVAGVTGAAGHSTPGRDRVAHHVSARDGCPCRAGSFAPGPNVTGGLVLSHPIVAAGREAVPLIPPCGGQTMATALHHPAIARRPRAQAEPTIAAVQTPERSDWESDVQLGKAALTIVALLFTVLFLAVPLLFTLIGNLQR